MHRHNFEALWGMVHPFRIGGGSMKRRSGAALGVAAVALLDDAQSQHTSERHRVQSKKLANGLEVLVIENHSVPM